MSRSNEPSSSHFRRVLLPQQHSIADSGIEGDDNDPDYTIQIVDIPAHVSSPTVNALHVFASRTFDNCMPRFAMYRVYPLLIYYIWQVYRQTMKNAGLEQTHRCETSSTSSMPFEIDRCVTCNSETR